MIETEARVGITPTPRVIERLKETAVSGPNGTWAFALGILLKLPGHEDFVEEHLEIRLRDSGSSGIGPFFISQYLNEALDKLRKDFLIDWTARMLAGENDPLAQINIAETVAVRAKEGERWAEELRARHRDHHPVPLVRHNLGI